MRLRARAGEKETDVAAGGEQRSGMGQVPAAPHLLLVSWPQTPATSATSRSPSDRVPLTLRLRASMVTPPTTEVPLLPDDREATSETACSAARLLPRGTIPPTLPFSSSGHCS